MTRDESLPYSSFAGLTAKKRKIFSSGSEIIVAEGPFTSVVPGIQPSSGQQVKPGQ